MGPPGLVGGHGAHHLAAEQRELGRATGAGRAACRDDHDVVRRDEACSEQWCETQCHRGRVAAGCSDPPGTGEEDALAPELGKAVGPGAGVDAAVVGLPGRRVRQAVVGTQVDHHRVRAQLGGHRGRRAVRQRQEDHIVATEHLGGRLLHGPVAEGAGEVRL